MVVGSWWRVEVVANHAVKKVLETWSAMGFVVYTSKFHFDIVSTISNAFWRWCSWIEVTRVTRFLFWGVILSTMTIFIVAWFSLYKFDGDIIEYNIDLQKFLNQFWSNTPIYIALFLHWKCSLMFWIVYWNICLLWCHCRGELLMLQSACQWDVFNDLHQTTCEWIWNILMSDLSLH